MQAAPRNTQWCFGCSPLVLYGSGIIGCGRSRAELSAGYSGVFLKCSPDNLERRLAAEAVFAIIQSGAGRLGVAAPGSMSTPSIRTVGYPQKPVGRRLLPA